jgi:hypothetical protein
MTTITTAEDDNNDNNISKAFKQRVIRFAKTTSTSMALWEEIKQEMEQKDIPAFIVRDIIVQVWEAEGKTDSWITKMLPQELKASVHVEAGKQTPHIEESTSQYLPEQPDIDDNKPLEDSSTTEEQPPRTVPVKRDDGSIVDVPVSSPVGPEDVLNLHSARISHNIDIMIEKLIMELTGMDAEARVELQKSKPKGQMYRNYLVEKCRPHIMDVVARRPEDQINEIIIGLTQTLVVVLRAFDDELNDKLQQIKRRKEIGGV